MKKIVKFVLVFLFIIFLIPITNASNTPSENPLYKSRDYIIDKYDVDIVVNKNNTFDITEVITTYFNIPKHGIFRTIPLRNTVTRLDGTTTTNHARVSNLYVDNEYSTSIENGNYKIKIGTADKTLMGKQTYIIKYNYNIGKDPIKDYDELYFNIIGNEWDTVIGNVTFRITMPEEFDSSKLGFSSGIKGLTDNRNIKYTVDGNEIIGNYNGILDVGEALTVRCELPEGYFVGASLIENPLIYLIFVIPILFLIISIYLWYKYGRDNIVIETVEFYPPEGFNSLEVGYMYKGEADNKDVISLLIYLANKGYIKIEEIKEKSLFFKKKGFKITKLKEYVGEDTNERIFLDGLFEKDYSMFNKGFKKDEVTSSDLYNSFYITMNKILKNMNNKKNKNQIFEKSISSKEVFVGLMIILTYCLITIPPLINTNEIDSLFEALLFSCIGFQFMIYLLFSKTQTIFANRKAINSPIKTKLFGLVIGLIFGIISCCFYILPSLLYEPIYLYAYILGIICIIGMTLCLIYLPKRTKYGTEMLGKIKGFRNFLITAEKDKLEALVMENPTYFYDILPYTYVLGVSDKWIKKFESISLQAPTWYESSTPFNITTFGNFMDSTMTSAQNVMSSSPSDSSSGGGSGGGSSGGGSGGGGGGSW